MAIPTDQKFSGFVDGGTLQHNDIVVGLRNGLNTRFQYEGDPGLYLPLAGGTMSGAIIMGGNIITGLPTPTNPSDAANKAYVDAQVGAYLPLAGGTMSGVINMGGNYISNIPGVQGSNLNTVTQFNDSALSVNYFAMNASTTGQPMTFDVTGSDSSVTMNLRTKNGNFWLSDFTGTIAPSLMWFDISGNHAVGFKAPDSLSANVTWTLPATDGSSGYVMTTDGSGNLSFASSGLGAYLPLAGGTMTGAINMGGYIPTGVAGLNDIYGNTVLQIIPTPSSVNYFQMYNRATGGNPTLTTTGSDASVIMNLLPKGGTVLIGDSTGVNSGTLLIASSGGMNFGLTAPSALGANTIYTTPINHPSVSGYVLSSTTAGVMSWVPQAGGVTPAALTKTDDANVTLTLGGTPSTALLQATSLTLGWTGELSLARGGTNNNLTASAGGIVWSDATKLNLLSGTSTAGQILLSGNAATPAWSTTTYPATNAINTIMYASSANVLGVITPVNSAVLISSAGGVPSMSTTLPSGLTIPGFAHSGANSDITSLTGLTGVIQAPTFINDTNGNSVLGFGNVSTAVNYVKITNSATGNPVLIDSTGSDSSVIMNFRTKNGNFYFSDSTGTIAPTLMWFDAAGTNSVGFKAPDTFAGNTVYTYPAVYPGSNGDVLSSTTSGIMSWVPQSGGGGTSTPTANTISKWDANVNMSAHNFINGYATYVNSGGTTTLGANSTFYQFFTGTTSQEVNLPVTAAMVVGQSYFIVNNSTSFLGVNTSAGGADQIAMVPKNSFGIFTCILASGNTPASWSSIVLPNNAWDSNRNFSANGFIPGYATTVTAGSTTTLTVSSAQYQYFTGTTTQTVYLPITSTLVLGQPYTVVNNSTGIVKVVSSGGNTIQTMASGATATFTCISLTGTTATSWSVTYVPILGTVISSQVVSGSSITLTTGTVADITSITLPSGTWLLRGNYYIQGATNITDCSGWINDTSMMEIDPSLMVGIDLGGVALFNVFSGTVLNQTIIASTGDTWYLSCYADFPTGSATACGYIEAVLVG